MTALVHDSHVTSIGELPNVNSQFVRYGVPAHIVHRTHSSDVFVTAGRVVGPSHFEVSAKWAASHPFYGPVGRLHDPLLLLETVREAIFLVGHGMYGIPRDTSFIARDKQFDVDPEGLRTAGDEPVDILIDITTTDIRRRGDVVAAMRFNCTCYRDGVPIGTASYQASFASAQVYKRLRGEYKNAKPALMCETGPVPADQVGRTNDIDVLLAEAPGVRGWQLRVDPAHPVIFDHVIDHVPGNAAVEAARQAAYLASGRPDAVLLSGEMSFSRYIEFDSRCLVFAQQTAEWPDGRRRVVVAFTQHDQIAAEGTFTLLAPTGLPAQLSADVPLEVYATAGGRS